MSRGVQPRLSAVENTATMRFQIQEMARVEKLISDEAIEAELAIYNLLIPGPGRLSARDAEGAKRMDHTQSVRLFLSRYWFALALVVALVVIALLTAAVNAATGGQALSGSIGYYLYLPLTYK